MTATLPLFDVPSAPVADETAALLDDVMGDGFVAAVERMLDACRPDGRCLVQPVVGYGDVWWDGGQRLSGHRAAFIYYTGQPIPAGLVVRHTCDRPPCRARAHLILGTESQNLRDRADRGRDPLVRRAGTAHRDAKLTPEIVTELRRRARRGGDVLSLAAALDVPYPAALRAVRGKTWAHVSEPPVPSSYRWSHKNPLSAEFTRPADVAEARRLYANGASLREVAEAVGVSRHTAWMWCGKRLAGDPR